jgi:hypothetical protein
VISLFSAFARARGGVRVSRALAVASPTSLLCLGSVRVVSSQQEHVEDLTLFPPTDPRSRRHTQLESGAAQLCLLSPYSTPPLGHHGRRWRVFHLRHSASAAVHHPRSSTAIPMRRPDTFSRRRLTRCRADAETSHQGHSTGNQGGG